jgi:hypothetical protein
VREFKGNKSQFEVLSAGNWEIEDRPDIIPRDHIGESLNYNAVRTQAGMESALNEILGGEEKIFTFQEGAFRHDVNVNAKALAEHLKDDPSRAPFLPLINEVLENPFEVWQTFERHKVSGKVVLRTRFVKAVDVGKKAKGVLFVASARNGQMEALTMIPMRNVRALNKDRRGKLVFARQKIGTRASRQTRRQSESLRPGSTRNQQ